MWWNLDEHPYLYRLIDVERGQDKLEPNENHPWWNIKSLRAPEARTFVLKHQDKNSRFNRWERFFLSWSKTLNGVRAILNAKKDLILKAPNGGKYKKASSQIVVRIDLRACYNVGIFTEDSFADLSTEPKMSEWYRIGSKARSFDPDALADEGYEFRTCQMSAAYFKEVIFHVKI